MKKSLAVAVLVIGGLLSISCGGSGVAPKETSAITSNITVTNPPNVSADADMKKLIGDLSAALSKNDTAALDRIYGDDYMLVTQTGEVMSKKQRLDAMKAGELKFESVAFNDINVRTYGETAVAIANSDGKNTFKGKTTETKFKVTFVAAKSKDGWRLVSAALAPRDGKTADMKKADEKKEVEKKEDEKKEDEKK